MGMLINIDNGGTLTDICVIDGDRVYRTKTLTTPYDLSKCFFEGIKKVSSAVYGHEDVQALLLATDHIRYSTTQFGTPPKHRIGRHSPQRRAPAREPVCR